MVFREVVGPVGRAAFPVDDELALADAVTDPVEAQVNGFGALLSDGVIGNTHGTLIVSLDGCGGLGMAQFGKGGAEHRGILSIDEEGSEFGFGGRGNNDAKDVAVHVDGAIEGRGVGTRSEARGGCTEIEQAASAGARFGFGQEGGITVNAEDHGARAETNNSIRMSHGIVKELGCGSVGELGRLGLDSCKGSQGNEHGGIDGTGIVQENANDLLDAGDTVFVEKGRGVDGCSELGGGTILRFDPGMG
jgi:hypothetical protein